MINAQLKLINHITTRIEILSVNEH